MATSRPRLQRSTLRRRVTPRSPVDDTATTAEDTPVIIGVLGNDSDPDGDTLTITGGRPADRPGQPGDDPGRTVALNRTARSASRRTPTSMAVSFRLHGERRHHAGLGHGRYHGDPVNDVPVAPTTPCPPWKTRRSRARLRPTTPRRATAATSGRWPRGRPTARSRWAPTAASLHPERRLQRFGQLHLHHHRRRWRHLDRHCNDQRRADE